MKEEQNAEERVAKALRALAAADEKREAPREIEARVLQAFRAQQRSVGEQRETSTRTPKSTPVAASRKVRLYAAWGSAAMAAAAAIAFGVWYAPPPPPEPPTFGFAVHRPEFTTSLEKGVDDGVRESKRTGREARDSAAKTLAAKTARNAAENSRGARIARSRSTPEPLRSTASSSASSGSPAASAAKSAAAADANSRTREVVTDFFPLMDPEPPLERGEIIRVQVPASTMRTVGLPVREDRWNEPVQADVLVGEEGLARAIRFVGYEVH